MALALLLVVLLMWTVQVRLLTKEVPWLMSWARVVETSLALEVRVAVLESSCVSEKGCTAG